MSRRWAGLVAGSVVTVAVAGLVPAGALEGPTIKEVMKVAMKGGLAKKVASGQASAEQQRELVRLMEALAANKPPRGEASSWESKTAALIDASRGVLEGKPDAAEALKRAINCKACHDAHKGE
ncbi:MAG: hypothetical protein KatS3mg108_3468 [Isosphaeraceae bacterium]|jgi:hypothetical protein|nr:MAG: hypothetical protein KatS3mg108_3468 [Isosphaeraceae bacterium]